MLNFYMTGYSWIRRSRGFCILALGMSLLTVILILMCLFLSIAADMLLTHVMTLLTSVISVSSIVVGVLIFTTNHMKLDEITMVSNNFGKLQVPVSKISWACWLSASAAPTAAMTVLFLGLNIVFFWQHSANDFRWKIYISLQICLPHAAVLQWGDKQKEILIAELNFIDHLSCKLIYNFFGYLISGDCLSVCP